jgi:hypothetical protein
MVAAVLPRRNARSGTLLPVTQRGFYPNVQAASVGRKLLGGLLLTASVFVISGCGNYGGPFNFGLKNNLRETVDVLDCNNSTCSKAAGEWIIPPGSVGQGVGVPDGVLRAQKVFSQSGKALGCLPFRFSTTPPGNLQVDVSEMVSCGDSGGAHGKDWPSTRD